MPEIEKLKEIIDNLNQYLMLNIEILKLEATNHVSKTGSLLIGLCIVSISTFLFVFSLTLGLGFYISFLLKDSFSGFLIVAAFYVLLTILLFLVRKKMIEKPLQNKIIEKILEDKEI